MEHESDLFKSYFKAISKMKGGYVKNINLSFKKSNSVF